jgi:hypothetical protein
MSMQANPEEDALIVHYIHLDCYQEPGITWNDYYDCACDSECPACGFDIQASLWHAENEACTEACDLT